MTDAQHCRIVTMAQIAGRLFDQTARGYELEADHVAEVAELIYNAVENRVLREPDIAGPIASIPKALNEKDCANKHSDATQGRSIPPELSVPGGMLCLNTPAVDTMPPQDLLEACKVGYLTLVLINDLVVLGRYDWNADPASLTLKIGNAVLKLIGAVQKAEHGE